MTRGPAVRGTAEYRGKTAVPIPHAAVPPRFRIPKCTENNEEPRSTAEYRGIGSETIGCGSVRDGVWIAFVLHGAVPV